MGKAECESLAALPNLGRVLAQKLIEIGIETPGQLREKGSRQVFVELFHHDADTCLCKLYAIEGAIRNVRWHSLPIEQKKELKDFYNLVTKKWNQK